MRREAIKLALTPLERFHIVKLWGASEATVAQSREQRRRFLALHAALGLDPIAAVAAETGHVNPDALTKVPALFDLSVEKAELFITIMDRMPTSHAQTLILEPILLRVENMLAGAIGCDDAQPFDAASEDWAPKEGA